MLATSIKTTKDWVIEAVLVADLHSAADIQDYITNHGKSVSLQTVYNSINALVAAGVVVKHKTTINISREWRKRMRSIVSENMPEPTLNDGDRVTYTFTSLVQLDIFWKHQVLSFRESTAPFPIFSYVPHDIWLHLSGRGSSQETFWDEFSENERQAFRVIGAKTKFDLKLKQEETTDYVRVDALDDVSIPRNEHITIIKDFITRTIYESELAADIDDIFATAEDTDELQARLTERLRNPGEIKLKIIRNNTNAKKLRRKLAKSFFISADLKSQFNLF